jgi:uncharacterized protein
VHTSPDFLHGLAAALAAFTAGVINSIAGGGTLVSFPTLIWLGLPSVTANATSTVAIWPGTVGGMFGYRQEFRRVPMRMKALVIPGVLGGALGAVLLRWTPTATFDHLVPYLILFATLLFMAQAPVQAKLQSAKGHESARWLAGAMLFQFLVGLYGGYFGAGIGILMLAALSILGMTDIHEMNGLKNFLGGSINGIAALYFIWAGMVSWPYVLLMAVAAISGGYVGAHSAKRIGRTAVRRIVICIGFAMAISLFLKK